MKNMLKAGILAACLLGLAGCMPVASPVAGIIFTDAKWGTIATPLAATPKTGQACAQTILGWFATGDASISTAKANGGVTKVAVIDHTSKNILGIFAEFCTIVKGE